VEAYKIRNLSFFYPQREKKALDSINITVNHGEFVTLCGESGCGKTTLLRLLKTVLSPHGSQKGDILFEGKELSEIPPEEQAQKIGFVMQNPESQIVTDKVWHELAFGLENLGFNTDEIRTRVAEMASFFGIQTWFHKKVTELSGGQKQLLNLASVMAMQPSVLVLDEPTCQLDPIAAHEFMNVLKKVNRELGTTVILAEHRLQEAIPISDRLIVMEKGRIIADGTPSDVATLLKDKNHFMYGALPTPMRIYGAVEGGDKWPLTVREGRKWLEEYAKNHVLSCDFVSSAEKGNSETVIELKDVWFRYEKNLPDVVKGLSLKIPKGKVFAILGGNGTGKTTALSLMSGLNSPYRGQITVEGQKITEKEDLYNGSLGVLPQNPEAVFVKKTVYLDLAEALSHTKLSPLEKDKKVKEMASLCQIEGLLESHPYDLSGGEQQRTALAKILITSPRILLMDEPTKGFDTQFKDIFASILCDLKKSGVTVVMVSHDIEFCAENADYCGMFFDGAIVSSGSPREFFSGKNFYTTAANRMARNVLCHAVLAEDIILASGKKATKKFTGENPRTTIVSQAEKKPSEKPKQKPVLPKVIMGLIWAFFFIISCVAQLTDTFVPFLTDMTKEHPVIFQLITVFFAFCTLVCFVPKRSREYVKTQREKNGITKRTLAAAFFILLAIPLTIFVGTTYLGDRKYYFISLVIILETLIPFLMAFEGRKPSARELVIISVLCGISVAGRTAFFMLPQFKPVAALVIISGVCFGGEAGFLVGIITAFVSNFFFGQGPWTPWQMFAFGAVGFLGGVLFRKGIIGKTKLSLSIFGAFASVVVFVGIMNPASALMASSEVTWELIWSACLLGLPYDLVHGASTAFFLWFISEPMIEKLERVKTKYGLIEKF